MATTQDAENQGWLRAQPETFTLPPEGPMTTVEDRAGVLRVLEWGAKLRTTIF